MNNYDGEELLRRIPLCAPSTALDQRVEKLLAAEAVPRTPFFARVVPVWQMAVACAACAAAAILAGVLLFGRTAPVQPPTEVRYVIQVDDKGFDVFDWTKYPKNRAPVSLLNAQRPARNDGGSI